MAPLKSQGKGSSDAYKDHLVCGSSSRRQHEASRAQAQTRTCPGPLGQAVPRPCTPRWRWPSRGQRKTQASP